MTKLMTADNIPDDIIDEIKQAIASKEYGSVEIYIESGRVVQITERTIKKTNAGKVPNSGYNPRLGFSKTSFNK